MPKLFAPPATTWAMDGREVDLLHYIYSRPDVKELRGNPHKVLVAIDEYVDKHQVLMNIGATKGAFISDLIAARKPSTMIELGGYVGYSAILFGDAVRAHGGKQYLSIENNPEMAAVANQLLDLAGLRDFVRIIVGSSDESLEELIEQKKIDRIELIFIDHWQELYLPDLWLLEQLDVLVPQTSVFVADNIIMPGAPKYLKWVEATPEQKREMLAGLDVGTRRPDPSWVYETQVSKFDTTWGKDAVAVTKVVGRQ
ncbi:hypothetical protein NUU61_006853 [Penicillium alfredii]|uniref:catechol O-methyltransferase n=1 Tax=Penicillium alfredii TaxID=1506179 RepID=A0A9W9F1N5_9EURO|nr:uncharacterized protein NUU61_006853 [Penicillium alfredii]KAJ5091983.1 hypothetical protein NUU61_006853 [Penicillium alfredii]